MSSDKETPADAESTSEEIEDLEASDEEEESVTGGPIYMKYDGVKGEAT